MPEISSGFLEKELSNLEERFLGRILSFMQGKLNKTEKIALASEMDFFAELQSLGLTRVLETQQKEYGLILKELSKYKQDGISPLTFQELETIMQLDSESILRRAQAYSADFKSSLLKGVVAGESTEEIRGRLQDIGLRKNETISAITTARDQFEAVSVGKVFEDEPNTKFKLAGPVDGKTRCECKAVMLKQPKSGLTKKEIDSGAWHKLASENCAEYNKRIAEGKQQKYGFINRGGFNCRHRIEIAE